MIIIICMDIGKFMFHVEIAKIPMRQHMRTLLIFIPDNFHIFIAGIRERSDPKNTMVHVDQS